MVLTPEKNLIDVPALPREAQAVLRDGKLVIDPPPAAAVEQSIPTRTLTIDPRYQKDLTALLKSYAVPYGAIAAVEPSTGRVLALAEYSHDAPQAHFIDHALMLQYQVSLGAHGAHKF